MARKFSSSISVSTMLGMVVAKSGFLITHFRAASGPPAFFICWALEAWPGRAGAITFMATSPMPASPSRLKAASLLEPTVKFPCSSRRKTNATNPARIRNGGAPRIRMPDSARASAGVLLRVRRAVAHHALRAGRKRQRRPQQWNQKQPLHTGGLMFGMR
jgi:hypothetical protein